MSFHQIIKFDGIQIGCSKSRCNGKIHFYGRSEGRFTIEFQHETGPVEITLNASDVKKIIKNFNSDLYANFKLKPPIVKKVGELLLSKGFIYLINKNPSDNIFKIFFNSLKNVEIEFMMQFFKSAQIIDQSDCPDVIEILDTPPPSVQFENDPLALPNDIKISRKNKKQSDYHESDDYIPSKRSRKEGSVDGNEVQVVPSAPTLRRNLRNRYEINLCEDMSEDAQLQEALKRSLKGIDQSTIDNMNAIESHEIEQMEMYENIDKSIELFTYNTMSRGEIIFRMEDYLCLNKHEYLSDVIIDFYFQYIYDTKMSQEQREKTYIFGTHFYTLYALSSDYSGWNEQDNAGLNAKEKRYKRVEGIIGEDLNIFEKDFLVIPLMDNNHWFLAIVCFPKLDGCYLVDGTVKLSDEEARRNKNIYQPPVKQPCILIFDSIRGNGTRRLVALNHLRNFLMHEWMNKYQNKFPFELKNFQRCSPKVPIQLNSVDCGCFILEFVERFFVTSPIDNFRIPLDLSEWFSPYDVRRNKRREIADVIGSMVQEMDIELPKLRFYGSRGNSLLRRSIGVNKEEENNNNKNENGHRRDENDNGKIDENGNDNNNDENFNNNNDFNCLDSNNMLQASIAVLQQAVQVGNHEEQENIEITEFPAKNKQSYDEPQDDSDHHIMTEDKTDTTDNSCEQDTKSLQNDQIGKSNEGNEDVCRSKCENVNGCGCHVDNKVQKDEKMENFMEQSEAGQGDPFIRSSAC